MTLQLLCVIIELRACWLGICMNWNHLITLLLFSYVMDFAL